MLLLSIVLLTPPLVHAFLRGHRHHNVARAVEGDPARKHLFTFSACYLTDRGSVVSQCRLVDAGAAPAAGSATSFSVEWETSMTDRIIFTSTTRAASPSSAVFGGTDRADIGINITPTASATNININTTINTTTTIQDLPGSPVRNVTSRKRGISYNSVDLVKPFEQYITWKYDWGFSGTSTDGIEYVPMLWDLQNRQAFISTIGNSTNVLSFNEPDLDSQANIDPETAAQIHQEVFKEWSGRVRVGSPAISNGVRADPPMGIAWLEKFLQSCGGCPVDFVAFHWYGSSDEIDAFRQHIRTVASVASKYGVKELWLTEFGVTGDASAQASFMSAAVKELESTLEIGRYAAFMASEGTLLTGRTLNSVGKAYIA